jgi:hypothetical protein
LVKLSAAQSRNVRGCRPSAVFGITVSMYYDDHAPPHFHARYGDHEISVDIHTGSITGYFPPSASKLVLEWMRIHRAALLENWRLASADRQFRPIAPLE